MAQTPVFKFYMGVIDEVVSGVREAFLDEGVDEQILQELKNMWESKLLASKAIEPNEPTKQPEQNKNTQQKQANGQQTATAAHSSKAKSTNQLQQIRPHPQPAAVSNPAPSPVVPLSLPKDNNKIVSLQLTLPQPAGSQGGPKIFNIQVPSSMVASQQLSQILSAPVITAAMSLPTNVASALLQQHITAAIQGQAHNSPLLNGGSNFASGSNQRQDTNDVKPFSRLAQVDGRVDSSDDDEEDEDDLDNVDDDNDDSEDDENENEENDESKEVVEEEPLNSDDDEDEEDGNDLFETDNVVVCQFDKVNRARNKWKFYLKDGIMNLDGKDFVFQKANGEAEW